MFRRYARLTALRVWKLERVMGIEPTLEAWEAAVLPLNYTRLTIEVRRIIAGA